jgi:hypothetical protein
MWFRRLCILVLAASAATPGCRPSYHSYEVGELEEERVAKAVKAIAAGIEGVNPDQCVSTLAPGYRDAEFDPGRMETRTSPDGVTVAYWRPNAPEGFLLEMDAARLRDWFAKYIAQWSVPSRALAKIREIQFNEEENSAEAVFFIDVYGLTAAGEGREDLLWVRLKLEEEGNAWFIHRFRIESWTCTFAAKAQFRDVSREVNGSWPHDDHPTALGFRPIPEQTADCGLACGDYDQDGDDDVYLCNGKRDTLLRNRGDGTFEDVTEAAGLGRESEETRHALIADFDNDGWPDLYVANNRMPCRLWKNNGDGTFRDVTETSGVDYVGFCTTASAIDFDRDGLLDIFQSLYGNFYTEFPLPPVYTGEPDRLYRNLGNMRFEEVGEKVGVGDRGWTLGATWGDSNNDGWPDLLLANDFGDKVLYINDHGVDFEDIAEDAGMQDRGFGMSASFGDIDNDGDLDAHFSNMYSNTNWIFTRPELLPMPRILSFIRNMVLRTLEEMTRGNSLFVNEGDGRWRNVTKDAGIEYGQWAWSSEFFDYDVDGDVDIFCLNGFISGTDAEDL